jgi:hypothetical protein
MKTYGRIGLVVCLVLLSGVVGAQTTTVQQTVDYTFDMWGENGVWFIPPGDILDHWPWYRIADEDWGWTHDVSAAVPADANGIASATLSVIAWNVTSPEWDEQFDKPGEQDVIYVEGINLGMLNSYLVAHEPVEWPPEGQRVFYDKYWSLTTFDLPAEVLQTLWTTEQLYVWLDIDKLRSGGQRVTLHSSTLTVQYRGSGQAPPPEPGEMVPVHRFWADEAKAHFFTASETEKEKLLSQFPDVWAYEGIAYYAFGEDSDPCVAPVHRFWSDKSKAHFYTISETEKNKLVDNFADTWTYEGVAWYAYPVDQAPVDSSPVYRFWSDSARRHFYTISETEKDKLINNFADTWTFESIAWYAYPPEP